jgi:LysR family transcriptional regulator, cyn operon transcriptional activator
MNINLEYYKVFFTIAKNKSITRAANELHISQPAISKMLKTMEGQIGKKLFIRENKGVILSKEGTELYNLISTEINNIIKAENVFSRIISNSEIKIAIHHTVLNYFIATKKFDSLLIKYPNISFFDTSNFDLLNSQLKNGMIDSAIIFEPTNYKFDNILIFKPLKTFHLCLICNKPSIETFNKPLTFLDTSPKYKDIVKDIQKKFNTEESGIITVNDYDNILPLVKNGYANGIAIKEFIEDELQKKVIHKISIEYPLPNINIGILYNINNEELINSLFLNFF